MINVAQSCHTRQIEQTSGDWIYYPDYSLSNPFQQLVYRSFPGGWRTGPGTPDSALALLRASAHPVVFHLHWEDACYRDASTMAEAISMMDRLFGQIDEIRHLGGNVVWTVHNEAPHEPRFPGLDARFRAELADHVDVVHMHSRLAAEAMSPALGIDPSTVLVTKLGGFKGFYPDDVSRQAARHYFQIDDSAPVFAMIGAMRHYKGVDIVLSAFEHVRAMLPDAQLILAGRMNAPETTRYTRREGGVILLARQVDDCAMQYVMRAADWAVFAFRKIMVSSSILLPSGFDVPVVAPDLPTVGEMVLPQGMGLLYPAGDLGALANTMIEAAVMDRSRRDSMIAAGHRELATRDYHSYATTLIDAVACSAGAADRRGRRPISKDPGCLPLERDLETPPI